MGRKEGGGRTGKPGETQVATTKFALDLAIRMFFMAVRADFVERQSVGVTSIERLVDTHVSPSVVPGPVSLGRNLRPSE